MSREPDSGNSAAEAEREIVIARDLDFPRELVWEAFTSPRHVPNWWGPDGFTTTTHEIDVRPGGMWRFIMHGPDGTDYPNRIVYREIMKPEHIIYDHSGEGAFADHRFRMTVTFGDLGSRTRLTMRLLFEAVAECEKSRTFGAIEGGRQTLGRLADYLATM